MANTHFNIRWTEDDVRKLCDLVKEGFSPREIAAQFGGKYTEKAIHTKKSRMGFIDHARAAKMRKTLGILSEVGAWGAARALREENEFLTDLAKHHPNGPMTVIEKPSKGMPLRFFPAPSQSYMTSPAAIAAE